MSPVAADQRLTFRRGRDDFHVLRILGNGQISAGKAAELLRAIQNGEKPDLPNFEAPAPEPTEIVRVAFCDNCRGQSD
jgi:hypothetical protein